MTVPVREDGYRAATESIAWKDRSDRGRLRVSGRAPVQMLDGILTASIPDGPEEASPGVGAGRSTYSAVLTPKGRMVTDLRILRLDSGEAGGRVQVGGPTGAPAVFPRDPGAGSDSCWTSPRTGSMR